MILGGGIELLKRGNKSPTLSIFQRYWRILLSQPMHGSVIDDDFGGKDSTAVVNSSDFVVEIESKELPSEEFKL